MRTIRSADRPTIPAGHENPASPGTWKRVLCQRDDFQPGRVQMVNWATMPVGRQFAAHYHEDMQEVFIILQGEAELTAGGQTVILRRGDTVIIDARETHTMRNLGDEPVEYIALGIAGTADGKTVVV
jgi:mannose-6-phosphate isomerase-like protein (cupin superfamily)